MPNALCIGINNYPGTGSDLHGCVNDANDWAQVLKNRGFSTSLLLDGKATRSAMIKAMTSIVTSAKPGETAVITYSGHGSWQADQDGDEPDMRDEALVPADYPTTGLLLDDDLFTVFSQNAAGSRIVFLSDSCHSGSVTRMAPPLGGEGTQQRDQIRFMAPEVILKGKEQEMRRARKAEKKPKTTKEEKAEQVSARAASGETALLISGCADTEFSYDAYFNNRPNGAMTRVAIDALAKLDAKATYAQWHEAIRKSLPSTSHPQTPQLMASAQQLTWTVLS